MTDAVPAPAPPAPTEAAPTEAAPPARPAAAEPEALAALVGARICHDLVNPLGAIGNGVELLALAAPRSGPELALIGDSLAAARARLQAFRLAFGPAAGGAPVARAEMLALLAALTRGSRLTVDWQVPDAALPRPAAKLALLMLLCAESALPAGGTIAVASSGGRWTLAAEGRRLRIEPAHWAALADPGAAAALGPAEVQFLLAGLELARQGRRLEAGLGETLRLSF